MAELAGHLVVVEVSPDDSTYTEIDDVKSCSVGRDRDMLDITNFKDTSGAKKFLAGLRGGKIDISGPLNLTDSAQSQLRSRFNDGAACFIGVKWDGSAGTRQKVSCLVSNYNESADVAGVVSFTCNLTFNGIFG